MPGTVESDCVRSGGALVIFPRALNNYSKSLKISTMASKYSSHGAWEFLKHEFPQNRPNMVAPMFAQMSHQKTHNDGTIRHAIKNTNWNMNLALVICCQRWLPNVSEHPFSGSHSDIIVHLHCSKYSRWFRKENNKKLKKRCLYPRKHYDVEEILEALHRFLIRKRRWII